MLTAIHKRRVPAGTKIRVLVVDDSVVIRRLVTVALSDHPDIEIVGSAANGKLALQRIPQVNPDVITLDIEMPEMDGIETLREIRRRYPDLCVIMFSTLTSRGASATLEALAAGANDYVTKASNAGSLDKSMANLREELLPRIRQFFTMPGTVESWQPTAASSQPVRRLSSNPRVVAIGISTGGPAALAEIVPQFPEGFPLPILIVQHMPPVFTRLLAERLQLKTRLVVREAAEGILVEPGSVYIAPGDYHMRVSADNGRDVIRLDQGERENSCRPAVDVLLRSVADVYGGDCVAAVLTGMGSDGLRGCELLKARGARIVVQDEATSVVWGMPGYVANAGLADAVVPLPSVVPEILRQAGL